MDSHNDFAYAISDSERRRDSQLLPSSSQPTQEPEICQHPDFYFEDGSVVFLADNILFKVHASRLAADPDVESYEFKAYMESVHDYSWMSSDSPGSNDRHPIVLPNVSALQLGLFFLVVFGRMGDETYTKFVTASQNPDVIPPKFTSIVADMGVLAVRFGMRQLDSWLQSQLIRVLWLAQFTEHEHWDKDTLTKIISYAQQTLSTTYQDEIFTAIRYILSFSIVSPSVAAEQKSSSFATCADLYMHSSFKLSTKAPSLFGFIFAAVLSLGHRSSFWTYQLTREDRTALYAAYADLTHLCSHKDVGWLNQPARIKAVCSRSTCSENFRQLWDNSFAKCKPLDSLVPLEDIREILTVPYHRQWFAARCRDWECESNCAEKTLTKIDTCVNGLFCWLADKYRRCLSNA